VLHPGGREKTDEMARACDVGPHTKVLDIGGGRGTTACHLARELGCEVVGIDVSPDMVQAALREVKRQGLEDQVVVQLADAHSLPFESESFDVILIECVTTLLDRDRAFPEFRRVLKPGGYLGDLEMTYQREPSEAFRRRLAEAWGGFTTMTPSGWEELFRDHGLEPTYVDDFSGRLCDMGSTMMKQLGVGGMAKMGCRLLSRPRVAMALVEWDRLLKAGQGVIGYGYIVGRRA
jgi:cyclopropane fatty-acyl-phospholipid synthase-like methyltransferase